MKTCIRCIVTLNLFTRIFGTLLFSIGKASIRMKNSKNNHSRINCRMIQSYIKYIQSYYLYKIHNYLHSRNNKNYKYNIYLGCSRSRPHILDSSKGNIYYQWFKGNILLYIANTVLRIGSLYTLKWMWSIANI